MPPARKPRWERRPNRAAVQSTSSAPEERIPEPVVPPKLTAAERMQLYARLLWLGASYTLIFAAEVSGSSDLMRALTATYTSAHTQRQMRLDTPAGLAARQAVETRLRDSVGFLERSRSRLYVPISQATKAVAYLASGVSKAIWVAERKARRVVGRQFAVDLLGTMVACRPPPEFEEQERTLIASIGFDQTYAKAGARTGVSSFNPIQTVDADGNRTGVERMVYINGQHFPVPRADTSLSDDAIARIRTTGPYTQDFRRILPLLQPYRLDNVMDTFVCRVVALLSQPPTSTREAMQRLLSRPNDDPGRETYLTYMPPLPHVNTQSYIDMIAIIAWCVAFLQVTPLILYLIGDGQSVLRLRDLKRLHPERYKHVVIGNGHFHSGAHSSFADVTLWWWCLLCMCMVTIGKVTRDEKDGSFKGTVRPQIKSLESNATEHVQQALLSVTVAIVVFFTTKVKQPPPELFLANPIAYMARIQNASAIVLAEFFRHSGGPTLIWQRATRGREGRTLDDLHCLALHKFRCAHKTSSTQISLLHLISIYGTHPALRNYLRQRLFVNLTSNVGSAVGTDKSLECMNEVQKEGNVGPSLIQSLSFTPLIQPMQYVYRSWKIAMGTLAASSTGVRSSMENEIDALVRLFESVCGTDLETYTTHNGFWYTGTPIDMRSGPNLKRGRPWEWIWSVASGRSSCLSVSEDNMRREAWANYSERHIREHMFFQ